MLMKISCQYLFLIKKPPHGGGGWS